MGEKEEQTTNNAPLGTKNPKSRSEKGQRSKPIQTISENAKGSNVAGDSTPTVRSAVNNDHPVQTNQKQRPRKVPIVTTAMAELTESGPQNKDSDSRDRQKEKQSKNQIKTRVASQDGEILTTDALPMQVEVPTDAKKSDSSRKKNSSKSKAKSGDISVATELKEVNVSTSTPISQPQDESQPKEEKKQQKKEKQNNSQKVKSGKSTGSTGNINSLTKNNFVCSICSSEGIAYFAVGHCNHAICSLCALRMRCKSKDRSCALCKANLDIMIVYPSTSHKTSSGDDIEFYNFGIIPASYSPNSAGGGMSVDEVLQIAQAQDPINVQVDHEQQMIYFSCREHFFENGFLKSIHCCCPSASGTGAQRCAQRCSSFVQLCQHVNSVHQGMAMCQLCLENRPLFLHEHEIFPNKKALKDHMKGGAVATVNTASGNSEVMHYTLGHPTCQFCQTNVFDKHALYIHMQREHITCHLCDSSMMFRYYKNVESLREHHRKDHFVCALCDQAAEMRASDISYAYRNFNEFSSHMKDCHGIRDSSKYLLGSRKFKESQSPSNNEMFFDLDLGAANPVPVIRARAAAAAVSNATTANISASTAARNDLASLIPANMRIAGRVTGTGTFSSTDQDMIALQAAIDASHATAATNAQASSTSSYASRLSQHRSANMSGANLDELFPALAIQANPVVNSNTAQNETTQKQHPLSLVGKKPLIAPSSASGATSNRPDDLRITRNIQLAEAFGLVNNEDDEYGGQYVAGQFGILRRILRTSDGLGIPITSTVYQNRVRNALGDLKIYPASSLFNFLFPIELLQWAKKQRLELLKVERKIANVLTSPNEDSVNLKPMEYSDRVAIHCLAKYYHFFSTEFDAEPKRYVCLTKTADSYVVANPLSMAVNPPLFQPFVNVSNNSYFNTVIRPLSIQQQKQRGPVIYLVLNEGLLAQWGRITDRNTMKGIANTTVAGVAQTSFSYSVVVFAEVLMSLRSLCADNNLLLEDIVNSIHYCGGNAIALQCHMHLFDDGSNDQELQVHLHDAIYLAKFLIHVSATLSSPPDPAVSTASYTDGDFLRYFRVHTDFEIPKEEEKISTSPQLIDEDRSTTSDNYVVVNNNEIVEEEQGSGRGDAWDDDDVTDAVKVLPPPGPNAYQPPRPKVSLAAQKGNTLQKDENVKDDWEEEEVEDEWETFLAERRQKALAAGNTSEPYRPRLLPKKEMVAGNANKIEADIVLVCPNEAVATPGDTDEPLVVEQSSPEWDEEEDHALAVAIANEHDEQKVAETIASATSWKAQTSASGVTVGSKKVTRSTSTKEVTEKRVVNRFSLLDSSDSEDENDTDSS